MLSFLVGHLHWCPCFFTRGVLCGSLLYVLSFPLRAASCVLVGCWPLYFFSWGIFCVACCCWRQLGRKGMHTDDIMWTWLARRLITLKWLVWLKGFKAMHHELFISVMFECVLYRRCIICMHSITQSSLMLSFTHFSMNALLLSRLESPQSGSSSSSWIKWIGNMH